MWLTMLMGLRNIWRRRLRTGLTVSMLAMGTFLLVLSTAMNEGPYADMIRMATSTWNGQVQVLHSDYKDSPSLFETVNNPDEMVRALETHPEIISATSRIETAGLLSVGVRSAAASFNGVDPKKEITVSSLPNALAAGSFLGETRDPDALPIVLGDGLAKRLRAQMGAEVVFVGTAADGSIAAEVFELVGIIDSGLDDLDAALALVRIQDAQELFVLEGRVHRVVGKATSSYLSTELKKQIVVESPNQFYVWDEIMPEVAIGIEQDRKGGEMFMFIIMLMVLLGTVNTLIMSVFERTREFGVMKALGTPRLQIVSMVFWEAAWMSALGVSLGVALGTGLVEYMAIDGLKMFDEPIEFGGLKLSVIYPMNTFLGNVVYPFYIVVASIIGASWPAWRASNLDPTAALREY